jgi:hypothetical protein
LATPSPNAENSNAEESSQFKTYRSGNVADPDCRHVAVLVAIERRASKRRPRTARLRLKPAQVAGLWMNALPRQSRGNIEPRMEFLRQGAAGQTWFDWTTERPRQPCASQRRSAGALAIGTVAHLTIVFA